VLYQNCEVVARAAALSEASFCRHQKNAATGNPVAAFVFKKYYTYQTYDAY